MKWVGVSSIKRGNMRVIFVRFFSITIEVIVKS